MADMGTTIKVPISKAKFYGYLTKQEAALDLQMTKRKGPQLLRTMFIASEIRDTDLEALAKFFVEMGEEEVISDILVTKNTKTSLSK